MGSGKYTILIEQAGSWQKVCKLWFGSDGSYYVTAPYHPSGQALLMKLRVNYARANMEIPFEEAVDLAALDDDERRLKLAHHPDGFVQFSGQGILSGRAPDGTARGMGVMSWPLDRPVRGPAFGLVIRGIDRFQTTDGELRDAVRFSAEDVVGLPGHDTVILEGHYLPALWRRFIRKDHHGRDVIGVVHPAMAVLTLRVVLPSERAAHLGFLGIEVYTDKVGPGFAPAPSFTLCGSAGNMRRNLEGEWTGETINCMYPRGSIWTPRSIEYRMAEVPQSPSS